MTKGETKLEAGKRFSAEVLIELSAHIGGKKKACTPSMRRFIESYDPNNNATICLKQMVAQLERAANMLYEGAANGKQTLVVATSGNVSGHVKQYCEKNSIMHIVHKWPGGLLSNRETTNKNIKKLRLGSPVAERTKRIFKGLVQSNGTTLKGKDLFKPQCILLFDPNETTMREVASNANVNVILIADTNTNVKQIQEANPNNIVIPLNTENVQAGPYVMKTLLAALLEGKNSETRRKLSREK
jgi:small subunit ribosomal protein S2